MCSWTPPSEEAQMNTAEAWLQLLPTMRWFAGKTRQIQRLNVRPDRWETPPGSWPAIREELITVHYADGGQEEYRTMSAYRLADQAVAECTLAVVELPELGALALSDLTADMAAMATFTTGDHASFHPGIGKLWRRPRPLNADQSNSSVRIASKGVFKLYRRLDAGAEREVELLGRLRHNPAAPNLYGSFHAADETCEASVLEYIDALGDGWQLASESCVAGTDFSNQAAELGRALRSIHHGLAIRDATVGVVSGADIAAMMATRMREVVTLAPQLAPIAVQLEPTLAALSAIEIPVQSVHGDFHLGQALYRKDPPGWVLIDFEGEPDSPADQRNRPDSPWRDVASALRSFGYVRRSQPDPDSPQTVAWHDHACQAFLDGYCDGDTVPTELLRAYHLDRGLYEVRYELTHRPDRAHIPLASIHDQPTGFVGKASAQGKE
jgi:maltokinase